MHFLLLKNIPKSYKLTINVFNYLFKIKKLNTLKILIDQYLNSTIFNLIKISSIENVDIIFEEPPELNENKLPQIYNLCEGGVILNKLTGRKIINLNNASFYLGSDFIRLSDQSVINEKLFKKECKNLIPMDCDIIEKIGENFKFQTDLSELTIEKQNYCLGKRFAEKEIINLGKSGLFVSIARCFAFKGKYLPKDQHFAYGNFIGQAEKGESVIVKTNGIVYRSYLDADDLVISLMNILQLSSTTCPIYNVGSDNQISLYDLAKSIAMKYGVNCVFENYNQRVIIDRYVPNTEKLKFFLK